MKTLHDLTPPQGTTKTVLLTRDERKAVGRRKLAQLVADDFLATGTRVTVKQNGLYFTLTPTSTGGVTVFLSSTWSGDRVVSPRPFTPDEFVEFLVTRFDPCSMVRVAKLARKNNLDLHSRTVEKDRTAKRAARRQFFKEIGKKVLAEQAQNKPNFVLVPEFKPNFVLIFEL